MNPQGNSTPESRRLHTSLADYAAALGALAAGGYTLQGAAAATLTLPHLALFHSGALAFLCLRAALLHRKKRDTRMPLLLAVLFAAGGAFGAAAFLLAAVAVVFHSRKSMPDGNAYLALFPDEKISPSSRVYERIIFGLDHCHTQSRIEPFQDILACGTLQQKQEALITIARYFHPRFAPLLLRALNDPDNAVRVLAAAVTAKIEKKFSDRYLALERAYTENPGNEDLELRFAQLCDDYSSSGIVEESGAAGIRNKAIALYEELYRKHPENHAIPTALGRLYLLRGDPHAACQMLEGTAHNAAEAGGAFIWYVEALSTMKDFSGIRSFSRRHAHPFSAASEDIPDHPANYLAKWCLDTDEENKLQRTAANG